MELDFSAFFTTGTVYLSVLIVLITTFIRKTVEALKPDIKQKADEDEAGPSYGNKLSRWYNKVLVYYIPVLIGCVLGAVIKSEYLFPPDMETGGRVLYGAICGWFSRDIYKFGRQLLKKQGVELSADPTASVPPPADEKGDA